MPPLLSTPPLILQLNPGRLLERLTNNRQLACFLSRGEIKFTSPSGSNVVGEIHLILIIFPFLFVLLFLLPLSATPVLVLVSTYHPSITSQCWPTDDDATTLLVTDNQRQGRHYYFLPYHSSQRRCFTRLFVVTYLQQQCTSCPFLLLLPWYLRGW